MVQGDGQTAGGALRAIVWGFLEVFTMGLYVVVGTLSQCCSDGVLTSEQEGEVGMGCVCIARMLGDLRGPSPPTVMSLLSPQRWRRRALAQRRWCPAHPHPLHLLGSTSRASCAMTSPLATTMGSAPVKAARCVRSGGGSGPPVRTRGAGHCVRVAVPVEWEELLCTHVVAHRLGPAWGDPQGL